MAWWRKKRTDVSTNIPFPRVPTPDQIGSYIKKLLRIGAGAEFFEIEPMEVTSTNLNDWTQGAILGTFINEPTQEVLGGAVLPLFSNTSQIPLIGEHVAVIEFNEQHYYFGVINRKNSINENSQPGLVTNNIENTKFGKTFERRDIRPVTLNEGDITYNGRFGQSIKLGGYTENNKPYIKIRCGQRPLSPDELGNPNVPIGENIESDSSSIYLLDNGLPWNAETDTEKFNEEVIEGKKILIKSDGIFISGRDNIKLTCINNIKIEAPNFNVIEDEIKLGSINSNQLQPVVRGDDLKELLEAIVDELDGIGTEIGKLIGAPSGPIGTPVGLAIKTKVGLLKTKLKTSKMLSTTVKTT